MQGTLEKLNNAVKKEKDEADALEKKIEEKKEAFKKVKHTTCTATAAAASTAATDSSPHPLLPLSSLSLPLSSRRTP